MARTKLTLQDVARTAADKNGGKGGRSLQRIAEKKGLTLSFTTVDRILAGKYESTPQRPTIEALAVLADVPVEDVYEAAGIPLPMTPLAKQLPEGSDQLTVDQRRVVLDVIRGFIRDNRKMRDLERERDERPLPLRRLLQWPDEHDPSTLEDMDFDELYDMVDELDRAVPTMDETHALGRYAARASAVLKGRQQVYMDEEERAERANAGRSLEGGAQPDGVTADDDPGQLPAAEQGDDAVAKARRLRSRRGKVANDPSVRQ